MGSTSTFVVILSLSTLALLISWTINGSEGFKATEHMYFDHAICIYGPKLTSNCGCKLKFITRMQKSFSSKCNITQLVTNVRGSTQLYYKYRNGWQLFLVNISTSLCDYVANKTPSKFMDIVWPKIRQYVTTDDGQNLTCPFRGRFDINELPISGAFFDNMFAPVGEYLGVVTISDGTELIWKGKFYATIPAGKTIEDDRMGR